MPRVSPKARGILMPGGFEGQEKGCTVMDSAAEHGVLYWNGITR